ncbi:unnamed protein product [Diabrotica balteata]|uniref:CCHC-type domain-containing protein n=1 Tax=Diabrotica balteata TaxID=107213 RepID=A0A9N9XDB6_DIABA|nr:unnamed protein product [Diabrotica balteata]
MKAAPGLDLDDVEADLRQQGIIGKVTEMKTRKPGATSSSYLLQVDKQQDLKDIKKINGVNDIRVRWDAYSKPSRATQCYNCQDFGHSARNCYKSPRCMKCAENHQTRNCPLPKGQVNKVRCCNCNEAHTSNYPMCSKHIEYLDRQAARRNRNQPQQKTAPPPPHPSAFRTTTSGFSYAQASKGVPQPSAPSKPATVQGTWAEINKIVNVEKMMAILQDMKRDLLQARSFAEKAMIFMKYEEIYNEP